VEHGRGPRPSFVSETFFANKITSRRLPWISRLTRTEHYLIGDGSNEEAFPFLEFAIFFRSVFVDCFLSKILFRVSLNNRTDVFFACQIFQYI
jgi:hypothetical protein